MEKLIKNTIIKIYCLRYCCQGTPKRAVHAEGGAVSINNTKVKSEDTEITAARNHRHRQRQEKSLRQIHEETTVPNETFCPDCLSQNVSMLVP